MKKIEFNEKPRVERRRKHNGRKGDKLANIINLTVYMLVIFALTINTVGFYQLKTANEDAILSQRVKVNANMINDLENELLKRGAEVDELLIKPIELMKANVMIYTSKAKGSGSIIRVENDYTYILTAAHVVTDNVLGVMDDGTLGYVPLVDDDITIIYGKDFKKKVRAKVQKIDHDLDVAVLKVFKKINVTPIKIAQEEPGLGDIVWSLSNPGRHEKVINKGIFSDVEPDYSYVALGGFFGSSGGMCVNVKGEQIGVISTVVTARIGGFFPSLTVYNGITRTKNLNNFLKGLVK